MWINNNNRNESYKQYCSYLASLKLIDNIVLPTCSICVYYQLNRKVWITKNPIKIYQQQVWLKIHLMWIYTVKIILRTLITTWLI